MSNHTKLNVIVFGLLFCIVLINTSEGQSCENPIRVWYGLEQKVGQAGIAQKDFNLLGNVGDPCEIQSLSYSLNGQPEKPLSVGFHPEGFGDGRRLGANGDFNADIPIAYLKKGENIIVLKAVDRLDREHTKTVTVNFQKKSRPLPVHIRWSDVKNLQNVGQICDGLWTIEDEGLRTVKTGYDRVFLIGEMNWTDYEATFPVTVHAIHDLGPHSGAWGSFGPVMRFQGHVIGGHRNFPYGQPKWGYMPVGAIGFLSWDRQHFKESGELRLLMNFLRGDKGKKTYDKINFQWGDSFLIKMRCKTLPDTSKGEGVTLYSFKIWHDEDPEPNEWNYQVKQKSKFALRRGSLGLIAHHVDATFGNVSIVPIKKP